MTGRYIRPISLLCGALILLAAGSAGCKEAAENAAAANNAKGGTTVNGEAQSEGGGNHLVGEQSLYLQQHAHNPVDWYPWGDEAFKKARDENKIILLSSGYSSCHWCHVMEEEVYSQEDVADALNASFVCIKLDREERPDIDAAYMEALEYLNDGNLGWPMNVFLTPELKPFFGMTYAPKTEFMYTVGQISRIWKDSPTEATDPANNLATRLQKSADFSKPGKLDKALFDDAAYLAEGRYDHEWGGLAGGAGTKFPSPPIWQFLLRYHRKTGSPVVEGMVKTTLDNMASGGLRDQLGGGFHRYSVDAQWIVPHFEKMLYDNAQLASLYTEASTVFASAEYGQVARETLDFMLESMSDKGHAFYSSFDADSNGAEGQYYVWKPEELSAIAGEKDGDALALLLGVSAEPNFSDHLGRVSGSVLTRRVDEAALKSATGLDLAQAEELFAKHRQSLLAARAKRVAPTLDKKVVTSWNGLAISAMAQGYMAFGEPAYLEAAQQTADWLWKNHHRPDGSLVRASTGGVSSGEPVLDDYAFFARGLLDVYAASGHSEYLAHAIELIAYARTHFRHAQAGFYLSADTVLQPLGGRRTVYYDNVEPSGMAVLLDAILRLAALTGNEELYTLVQNDLAAYVPLMKESYINMALWLDVALRLEGPYYDVVIAGDPQDSAMQQMLSEYRKLGPAHAVLVTIPAAGADAATTAQLPTLLERKALDGKATAFVCEHGVCKRPTQDPAEFRAQIMDGWKK